jgi:hypothetical protein
LASVILTPVAWGNLQTQLSRELPDDARDRVRVRLRQLEAFPESGPRIESGEWDGARYLDGPWWFLFVYVYDQANDAVIVTTIRDKRTAIGAQTTGT